MYPLVSICVPVYNVEPYLERCVESLFRQSYSNLEFIFVDDCSPDNSVSIITKLGAEFQISDKIRIISHKVNRGLAAARNTAVSAASGEFIVHVDSDDWVEPSYVEALVKQQVETGADIVSCNTIAHYPNGVEYLREPSYNTPEEMVHKMIHLNPDHVIWRRLIRRSLYTENNIKAKEGLNIGEDHHTLPILAYFSRKVATIPDFNYHYNCENRNSYMQLASQKFSAVKYSSDRDSTYVLLGFFSSICSRYCDELYVDLIKYEYQTLKNVSSMSMREEYGKIVNDIYAIPQKYWAQIGWNRKAYRILESSCSGMKAKLLFQRIKHGSVLA